MTGIRSLRRVEGTVSSAIGAGKTRLCKTCAKNFGIEIDENGAITSIAAALTPAAEEASEAVEEAVEAPAA